MTVFLSVIPAFSLSSRAKRGIGFNGATSSLTRRLRNARSVHWWQSVPTCQHRAVDTTELREMRTNTRPVYTPAAAALTIFTASCGALCSTETIFVIHTADNTTVAAIDAQGTTGDHRKNIRVE